MTYYQGTGMASESTTSSEYWNDLQISRQDVEYLHTYLFEQETPLTTRELVAVFVNERIRVERLAAEAEKVEK